MSFVIQADSIEVILPISYDYFHDGISLECKLNIDSSNKNEEFRWNFNISDIYIFSFMNSFMS